MLNVEGFHSLSKKENQTSEQMIKNNIIAKVDLPTDWISMLIFGKSYVITGLFRPAKPKQSHKNFEI